MTRAIVLAAGRGSRLYEMDPTPKPLVRVAGRPLLQRTLESLVKGGVGEAVVVLGYQAQTIREAVLSWGMSLPVRFVLNDRWERSNGLSVLAAAAEVEHGTFLSMSDHLLGDDLVRAVADFPLADGDAVLGVDRDVRGCFDIDDATKVLLDPGGITEIGKTLDHYDAIDTGCFRIGPSLVEALRAAESRSGDASLSDGIRALCGSGRMRACDVGGAFWLDVDTPAAFAHAELCLARLARLAV
ncbi:MAG: NTP transferase domain-containing protein [Deltaproteobacteria bacterium]|nr:NTP transferase domain-containing protein [Deltaproteobacteria bacterium]